VKLKTRESTYQNTAYIFILTQSNKYSYTFKIILQKKCII